MSMVKLNESVKFLLNIFGISKFGGSKIVHYVLMGPVTHKILFFYSKPGPCSSLLRNVRQTSTFSTKSTNLINQLDISKPTSADFPSRNAVFNQPIGQPTHLTHPHKILAGEIVPGIKKEEFQARRCKLVESLERGAGGNELLKKPQIIIIPSSQKKYMTEAIPYLFRQNSDFLYLTGCMEPDSVLVIKNHGAGKHEDILFIRGKDPHAELWDGPRTGVDEAVEFFGVDKCFPISDFKSFVTSYAKEHGESTLLYDYMHDIHPLIHKFMKEFLSEKWNRVWESPRPFIHKLRLHKSPAEQELMKKSCLIGSEALKNTIKDSKPWDNEAQIFARMDYECRMNGAEYLAYPPVVAGGDRANIIHYINNDQVVRDGELVLMDAGCEYHGYSSDITRTWPISGCFSPAQKILYEIVYSVQEDLIKMCMGLVTLTELYYAMNQLLGNRLFEAGVISNKFRSVDVTKISYLFCPHDVSHFLGMDIHDTSSVSRSITLEPGMVFTIEPGIYVSANNKVANPEFLGNGIRIEDDILMTSNGPLVLTSFCPKHPDEIEKLAKKEN